MFSTGHSFCAGNRACILSIVGFCSSCNSGHSSRSTFILLCKITELEPNSNTYISGECQSKALQTFVVRNR